MSHVGTKSSKRERRSRYRFVAIGVAAAISFTGCAVSSDSGATSTTSPRVESTVTTNDLQSAAESTAALDGYLVTYSQDTPPVVATAEIRHVGLNYTSTARFGEDVNETRRVDGRLYEREGTVWFLKPWPASLVKPTVDLVELAEALSSLPSEQVDSPDGLATFRLTCGLDDRSDAPEVVRGFCSDRVETRVSVNPDTGLIELIYAEGEFEIFPGRFADGRSIIEISALPKSVEIEPPDEFNRERADCIGAELGTDDYEEMSELLDETTTAENGSLFNRCDFLIFPPGNDFE